MLCVQEEVCGGGGGLTAWPFQGTAHRKAVTEMAVLWLSHTSVESVPFVLESRLCPSRKHQDCLRSPPPNSETLILNGGRFKTDSHAEANSGTPLPQLPLPSTGCFSKDETLESLGMVPSSEGRQSPLLETATPHLQRKPLLSVAG